MTTDRRAPNRSRSRARSRSRGQALMEFALAAPVFLVMLFGVVDVGRIIWATTAVNSAAREAARYAIVHGGTTADPCPVGPAGPDTNPKPALSCVYSSWSAQPKQYIYDTAQGAAIGVGPSPTVTACYGVGCTGNADTDDNARGNPVTVVVSSQLNLFAASLLGMSTFTVTGTSTMVVNH